MTDRIEGEELDIGPLVKLQIQFWIRFPHCHDQRGSFFHPTPPDDPSFHFMLYDALFRFLLTDAPCTSYMNVRISVHMLPCATAGLTWWVCCRAIATCLCCWWWKSILLTKRSTCSDDESVYKDEGFVSCGWHLQEKMGTARELMCWLRHFFVRLWFTYKLVFYIAFLLAGLVYSDQLHVEEGCHKNGED